MQRFNSDGVTIAYIDEGQGDPVLLIHGFASNATVNWRNTNWIKTLNEAGYRIIAFDNRGHGHSEKLYDPERYDAQIMAEDACRLLDHLGLKQADVIGFSMGARISTFLTIAHPERVRSLMLSGFGANMIRPSGASSAIATALEAPNAEDIKNEAALSFRVFAEQTKGDLRALAACMRGPRPTISPEELGAIKCPVLISVGSEDIMAGSGEKLAAMIPGAESRIIPGRDHMKSVGDLSHKKGVVEFLSRRP